MGCVVLRHIRELWWLWGAGTLALIGENFWQFNVMELFASIAIVVGVFFAIRSWRRDRRKKKVRQIKRDTLVNLLEEGRTILTKCFEKNSEAPEEETNLWGNKVYNYLEANLGKDYAVRFESHEGLPIGLTTLSGMHARAEGFIKTRLARLNEFLSELV